MSQKQKSAETGQKTLRGGEGVNLYPKTDETRIYPVSVANRGLLEALHACAGKIPPAAVVQRTGRKGHTVAPLKEDVRITAAEHRLCRRIEAAHATHAYAVPGWDTRRHGVWEMGKDAANAERSVAGLIDWDAVEKANAESREEAL